MSKTKTGFTLIELLIVVAIIAILAAIAIPNFLAAQVRAKVSRVEGELRNLAIGLESYYTDNNDYPPDSLHGAASWQTIYPWRPITTPIAYITSIPRDLFNPESAIPGVAGYYTYIQEPGGRQFGPDQNGISFRWCEYSYGPSRTNIYQKMDWSPVTGKYDPTNGIVSYGQIGRYGP